MLRWLRRRGLSLPQGVREIGKGLLNDRCALEVLAGRRTSETPSSGSQSPRAKKDTSCVIAPKVEQFRFTLHLRDAKLL
jgi:hypothetical protein